MATGNELTDEEVFGNAGNAKPQQELTDAQVFGTETAKPRQGLLDQITNIDNYTYPFLRAGGVFEEELSGGLGSVKKGLDRPAREVGGKLWDVGMGALRTVFSPVTGVARAFAGEPSQQLAERAGVSPEVSQNIGTAAEIGAYLFTPVAMTKAVTSTVSKGDPFLKKTLEAAQAPIVFPSKKDIEKAVADKVRSTSIGPIEKAKLFLETDLSKIAIPIPSKDRQVNYANLLITTDDTKRAIYAAEKIRGSTKTTIPWGKTEELASDSGLTIKDLLSRGAREGHNATQMETFKSMMNAASRNVMALRDKINTGAATDADKAVFYAQFNEMMDMQRQFQGAKSEAGRVLNILKKPTGPGAAQASVLKALSDGKLLLKNGGKVEELGINELSDLLTAMDSPEALARFVESASKATTLEKVMWGWRSGLLSGLRTHEVNFLSNTLVEMLHFPERAAAATLGKILPRKDVADKVYFKEIPSMISGAINGVKEGSVLAAKTDRKS